MPSFIGLVKNERIRLKILAHTHVINFPGQKLAQRLLRQRFPLGKPYKAGSYLQFFYLHVSISVV